MWAGLGPSEGHEGRMCSGSLIGLYRVFPCVCMASALSACLWVQMSSFYKVTSHNKLGYTLMTSSSQIISLTTLFPSTISFLRHHGLWMLGVHNSTHNDLIQWEASMWERCQESQFSLSSPTSMPWNWKCLHHSRLLCKISDLPQIQINSKMLLSFLKCLYVWNKKSPRESLDATIN